ncbi:MAG TPA: hypothetical protein O0X27_04835 [Methanocorpusculum sp.]|nr:hypothetical protein [Methanocorpusculum sp.]
MNNSNPESKVVCITLPLDLADKLDDAAAEERRTRSNMVAVIIRNYFGGR